MEMFNFFLKYYWFSQVMWHHLFVQYAVFYKNMKS